MNAEPQESTVSSRPNVESLRSSSDQNVLPRSTLLPLERAGTRREHSDGDLARRAGISGRRSSNNNLLPSLPHEYRVPGLFGALQLPTAAIPPRTHSLSNSDAQTYTDEARRRAMILMLRQRRETESNMDRERSRLEIEAERRRSNSLRTAALASQSPRRHAASFSTLADYGSPDTYRRNRHTTRTDGAQSSSEDTSRQEYVVPPWQPDSEVTECPICKHPFSFFYRKHHCRKCGRVVCANCSPHKITMPRQYIVNPPVIDLTGSPDPSRDDGMAASLAADQLQSTSSGGLEVRLCNPCAPDPNPLPPPPYAAAANGLPAPINTQRNSSSNSDLARRRTYHMNGSQAEYSRYMPAPNVNPLVGRRISSQIQPNPLAINSTTPYGSAPDSATMYTSRHGYPRSHRQHASLSMLPNSRHRAIFDAMTSVEAPPEELPRRQIAEEDECPICHEEMPPKGPDGSETDREAHVSSCVEGHFSSSRPNDSSMLPPSTAIAAAVVASGATPAQAGSSLPNAAVAGPSVRRRTTGMVVYHATEKDCMGEDGATQECIICFEDFEPGLEMGRLECLCKFHKACIRGWWDTKGVGACPVHQGGLI